MSEAVDAPATIWTDRFIRRELLPAGELARRFNLWNPRSHPEAQRDATESSLDTVGWIDEISLSTNGAGPASLADNPDAVMFDGHERVELVLVRGGEAALVPVKWYQLSVEETDFALLVKDQTTEMAETKPKELAALLERTRTMTVDPRLAAMLERLRVEAGINGNGSAPPEAPPMVDKAEELQAKWKVNPGDLWEFESVTTPGRFHRLLCGDCRNPDDLMRLADGQQVNGVFTSPPYAEQRKQQYGGVPVAEYVEWWGAVQTNVRSVLAGDGSFFVNIKPNAESLDRSLYVFDLVCAMVRLYGWHFLDEYCWLRNGIPQKVTNRFKNDFEPVYAFILGEFKFRPEAVRHFSNNVPIPLGVGAGDTNAARRQGTGMAAIHGNTESPGLAYPSNLLRFTARDDATGHAAAFPVALPTFFIRAYSDFGDVWLDPFCGSGTVLVAAENEGRIAMGTEILPKYCSVILERVSQLTGQTPRRAAS